ncbi:MAG TPA: glycosyltransferase [Pyrinomonadaceae bacterium]|jgi:glycosyltransferase involved in cell wall biosynthesis
MKFSVIIPAYNEEKLLPKTLRAVGAAAAGLSCEIIVVDNESTDKTAQIAAGFGAKVVSESEHNIAQVRNTGAKASSGDVLIFIDADTIVRPALFQKIERRMKDEKCFGGAVSVEYGEFQKKWMKYYLFAWKFWETFFNMKMGAAQFCLKAVFEKLGGYDKSIFVGEDIEFYWRLAKFARRGGGHLFFVREPKVKTSARRLDKISFLQTFVLMNPIYIRLNWRKKSLWKAWYEKTIR